MWKAAIGIMGALMLSGCVQPDTETAMPIDGSRTDGFVVSQMKHNPNLGYEPNYAKLKNSATTACLRWGYKNAAQFGAPMKMCEEYDASGRCNTVQITQKYQCSVL